MSLTYFVKNMHVMWKRKLAHKQSNPCNDAITSMLSLQRLFIFYLLKIEDRKQ